MRATDYQQIYTLVPEMQGRVIWLLKIAAAYGADVAVVSAFRERAEQERLYQIGRRGVPGEVPVTWTLDSAHLTGRAVDLAFRVGGSVSYDVPAWWWDALGYLGSFAGLVRTAVSRGDLGHFELARSAQRA